MLLSESLRVAWTRVNDCEKSDASVLQDAKSNMNQASIQVYLRARHCPTASKTFFASVEGTQTSRWHATPAEANEMGTVVHYEFPLLYNSDSCHRSFDAALIIKDAADVCGVCGQACTVFSCCGTTHTVQMWVYQHILEPWCKRMNALCLPQSERHPADRHR